MEISLGEAALATTAETVRISSHRIQARVEWQQPLRGVAMIPRARGGRAIGFTIEVLYTAETYAAAETFRTALATTVEALMEPSDTARELYIEGRATYAHAVIEDVDIQDLGIATKVIYRVGTSGVQVVV